MTLLANAALLSLSSVLILYIYNRMACPAAAVLVGSDIIDLRRMGRKGGRFQETRVEGVGEFM